MNILFLIGSPRKKSSASCYFARILKFFLTLGSFGKTKVEIAEIPPKAAPDIMAKLAAADKVVIFTPLYCDGMPSHVISFLQQAEIFCRRNPCSFDFYAVCNNGFIEGRQNEACLNQYQCFCQKTGVNWCGGMGIGGGEMLHFLAKVYPFVFLFFIVLFVIRLFKGYADKFALSQLAEEIGVYLFFTWHCYFSLARFAAKIANGKTLKKNIYSRAFVPAIIFMFFASIFMCLGSLLNGRIIFTLLGKDKTPAPKQI